MRLVLFKMVFVIRTPGAQSDPRTTVSLLRAPPPSFHVINTAVGGILVPLKSKLQR